MSIEWEHQDPTQPCIKFTDTEATQLRKMILSEVHASQKKEHLERTHRDEEIRRQHELEVARISSVKAISPPVAVSQAITNNVGMEDAVEAKKLEVALRIWDLCRVKGKVGCGNCIVRQFITQDIKHPFSQFNANRKKAFDALEDDEQQLLMNEPIDITHLPPALQRWMIMAYQAKCVHLELLYIQAEIWSATKHTTSVASIKESIEIRRARFERQLDNSQKRTRSPARFGSTKTS